MAIAKTTTARAFVLALLSHVIFFLLAPNVNTFKGLDKAASRVISVKLRSEPATELRPRTLVEEVVKTVLDADQSTQSDEILKQSQAQEKSQVLSKPNAEQVPLSISSIEFKQFLKAELLRDRDNNPSAPVEFSNTFKPYFEPPPAKPAINYAQGPLGGGQYKVHKNGKVYCVLKMVPQTFDEINGQGFIGASRDCSPRQKFDLNLRTAKGR